MNNNSFRIFHQAPDDDLLEEAYQKPRRRHWQVWVGVAACLCLLIAGLWQRNVGPVATVEALADLGYDFVLMVFYFDTYVSPFFSDNYFTSN